jgi:hypothetical protein
MILKLASKSLLAHPVRTALLGLGFGLGVSVMATLLGVGEVVLEQSRAPALVGGGEWLVTNVAGPVSSARFALAGLLRQGYVASPRRRANLFLVRPGNRRGAVAVRARGGVPSLERALGDPETARVSTWTDTAADQAWARPDQGDVLRAMDVFHPIPPAPGREPSWAEWLYFRGQSAGARFYLTFLAGPRREDGRRVLGVRLQLDRDGEVTTYSDAEVVDESSLLRSAPNVTVRGSRVVLDGLVYRIHLELPRDVTGGRAVRSGVDAGPGARIQADLAITASAGRAFPPVVLRGAGGWVSGYVVPVMSGPLSGSLVIGGREVTVEGTGYHDHNWGFWEGVSWRWGHVEHEGLAFIYGRVIPPVDAADPDRLPGFVVALGPDGPLGYSADVRIEETDDPATGRPRAIAVEAGGRDLAVKMQLAVDDAVVTRGGALTAGPDFLQLRARYTVKGRAGGQAVDFTAIGAAETFRAK